MKASYIESAQPTLERAAPFPTAPQTEDIIVPRYDQTNFDKELELTGQNDIALTFHDIDQLSERPELEKFASEYTIGDEYGLVYNAVGNLVDVNDAVEREALSDERGNTVLTEKQKSRIKHILGSTVNTVLMQMRFGRMQPVEAQTEPSPRDALKVVLQMEKVVREERELGTFQVDNVENEREVSQPHISLAEKHELTKEEKRTSKLFGKITKKLFGYKSITIKDLLETLPRSGEIPTNATRTLPTVAIEATGITRP